MKKRILTKPTILCLLLLVSFAIIAVFRHFSSKSRPWLLYTPKSIGQYGDSFTNAPYLFDEKQVIINDQAGNTYALDRLTGKIVWTFQAENYSPFVAASLNSELVAINDYNSIIYALNKVDGHEVWRFYNPSLVSPDTPIITDQNDQNLFFGDRAGQVYALDKKTGEISWQRQFKAVKLEKVDPEIRPIHLGRLSQDEDHLYLRSKTENKIIALTKKTGEIIWQTNENEVEYQHQNLLVGNKNIIANTDYDTYILDKESGKVLWSKEIYYQPKLDNILGNDIYLVTDPQKLEKIQIGTGETVWSTSTNGYIQANPQLDRDNCYLQHEFTGTQTKLIALNRKSGLIDWSLKIPLDLADSPLMTDNSLFFGSQKGQIFQIDKTKGEIIKDTYANGQTEKIIQIDDGLVIVALSNNYHLILSKLNHDFETIWTYTTPYQVFPEFIHFAPQNQRLYFTSDNKQLITSVNLTKQKKFDETHFYLRNSFETDHDFWNKREIHFLDQLPKLKTKIKLLTIWNKVQAKVIQLQQSFETWQLSQRLYQSNLFKTNQTYDGQLITLSVQHQAKNLGPTLDKKIKIQVIFTSPQGNNYLVKGFQDKKNTWKVRFRPDVSGMWQYSLTLQTPVGISNFNDQGSVEIDDPSQYQYLQLDPEQPFNFFLEDGTIFHPLGLEDVIIDFNYDANPLNQWGSTENEVPKYELAKVTFTDMEDYLQLYQKAGFNLFRWGVNNASFNLWKDENNQTDWLYSQYGDKFVQALKDQQYHIMMTIYGFFPPHAFAINNQQHQAEIKKQLDYVVARYSSYVDIWEINNEATVSQEWLEFVIDYLHEIDPYQHPITTNWDRPELQALDLQSIHWYEFVKDTTPTAANTKNAINFYKQFQKPILFSETGNTNKSWDENSATRLRLRLWSGLFNQGYFVFWNQSREMYFNPDNANIYLGPNERQFTKTFSDFTAKIDRSFQPLQLKQVDPKYEIYGLKNQKHIYLYMVKIRKEDQVQELTLPFMIENYTWFDPSTGQQLTKPLDSIQVDADQEGVVEEKITLPNFKTDLLIEVNLAATNNETNHE